MIQAADIKIITLSENTVSNAAVGAEWGLSIYIEAGEQKLLLDTGGGDQAVRNADSLGIDLSGLDAIVLSHSHFDHTGGLPNVLSRISGTIPVYGHPDLWGSKYAHNKKTDTYHYLGIPYVREYLESLGARFSLSTDPQWIAEGIVTSGEEPMETQYEAIPGSFQRKTEEKYVKDTIPDDQSLFIQTDLGLLIILGCAHRGMINIINHARTITNTSDVHMIIGGTHLISADNERITQTVKALKDIDMQWLGVSHCTGFAASARLADEFGDRFFLNNAGKVIEFPFG